MKIKLLCVIIFLFFLVSCATTSEEERIANADEKMKLAYNEGDTQDTWNLRSDASFEVQVAEGVWWVPANTLGKSRYTNKQIAAIVNENPKVKKALIGNLYEAIQLFQICDFTTDTREDHFNVRVEDPVLGYDWEKHCPGYYAVSLNRGNCSTDTNWLIYLLNDDYEEWGTFNMSDADGSGHVINYFFFDGYYYFIDMTHYRNDFRNSAVENGDYRAYRNTDVLLGNIHKTVSPEAYVKYYLQEANNPPSLFYTVKGHEVADLTSDFSRAKVHMVLDASIKKDMTVVYLDDSKLSYAFYNNSTSSLLWNDRKRHPFAQITDFSSYSTR